MIPKRVWLLGQETPLLCIKLGIARHYKRGCYENQPPPFSRFACFLASLWRVSSAGIQGWSLGETWRVDAYPSLFAVSICSVQVIVSATLAFIQGSKPRQQTAQRCRVRYHLYVLKVIIAEILVPRVAVNAFYASIGRFLTRIVMLTVPLPKAMSGVASTLDLRQRFSHTTHGWRQHLLRTAECSLNPLLTFPRGLLDEMARQSQSPSVENSVENCFWCWQLL